MAQRSHVEWWWIQIKSRIKWKFSLEYYEIIWNECGIIRNHAEWQQTQTEIKFYSEYFEIIWNEFRKIEESRGMRTDLDEMKTSFRMMRNYFVVNSKLQRESAEWCRIIQKEVLKPQWNKSELCQNENILR